MSEQEQGQSKETIQTTVRFGCEGCPKAQAVRFEGMGRLSFLNIGSLPLQVVVECVPADGEEPADAVTTDEEAILNVVMVNTPPDCSKSPCTFGDQIPLQANAFATHPEIQELVTGIGTYNEPAQPPQPHVNG